MTAPLPRTFRPPLLHPIARIVLYCIAFMMAEVPAAVLFFAWASARGLNNTTQMVGALNGDMTLALTAVAFLFVLTSTVLFCIFLDRRPFHTIGVALTNQAGQQFALGLLLGAGMVWLNVGLLALLGHVESSRLAVSGSWQFLLLYLLGFLVQSGGEEMVARGYVLQNLLTWCGTGWAVAAQAIMFALLHGANPGGTNMMAVVNLLLFATASGLAYLRLGNLWLLIGVHTGWNFCLANIAGLVVSGISLSTHVFDIKLSGNALWTGGEFGLEASLMNTIVWAAFCVTFALIPVHYSTPTWWENVRRFKQFVVIKTEADREATSADIPVSSESEAPAPNTNNE